MYPLRRDVEADACLYSERGGVRVEPRITRTFKKGTWVRLLNYGLRSCSIVLPDEEGDGREWWIREWDWRTEEDPVDYNHPASFEKGTRDLAGAWVRSQARLAVGMLDECAHILGRNVVTRKSEQPDPEIVVALGRVIDRIETSLATCRILEKSSRSNCCPGCGAGPVATTCVGQPPGDDRNKAVCDRCGWNGIAQNAIAAAQNKETPSLAAKAKRADDTWGWLLVAAMVFLMLVLPVALWPVRSYYEAQAYERVTGRRVSTWDAMFIELRVQAGPEED